MIFTDNFFERSLTCSAPGQITYVPPSPSIPTLQQQRHILNNLSGFRSSVTTSLDLSVCDLGKTLDLTPLEEFVGLETLVLDSCSISDKHWLPRQMRNLTTLR